MATLNLPAWGYGIRYTYGMFRQTLINGFQHEQPDYWLTFGNPWEIERLVVKYPVQVRPSALLGHTAARIAPPHAARLLTPTPHTHASTT
jgi:glucan phosphorylase